MSVPTPEQVDQALEGVIQRARGLGDLYRQVYPSAFERRVGESAARPLCPLCRPNAPCARHADQVGSDTHRDTGDVLLATHAVRARVERAGKAAVAAHVQLAAAWAHLGRALAAIEDSHPAGFSVATERLLERTMTPAERKADQKRRRAAAKVRADRIDTYAAEGLRLHDTGAGEGRR